MYSKELTPPLPPLEAVVFSKSIYSEHNSWADTGVLRSSYRIASASDLSVVGGNVLPTEDSQPEQDKTPLQKSCFAVSSFGRAQS